MVNAKINGKAIQVDKGTSILKAAEMAGYKIPTLCYLEEINEKSGHAEYVWWRLKGKRIWWLPAIMWWRKVCPFSPTARRCNPPAKRMWS